MRAAKVKASYCIPAVSPEPVLLAHVDGRPMGNFNIELHADMRPHKGAGQASKRLIPCKV